MKLNIYPPTILKREISQGNYVTRYLQATSKYELFKHAKKFQVNLRWPICNWKSCWTNHPFYYLLLAYQFHLEKKNVYIWLSLNLQRNIYDTCIFHEGGSSHLQQVSVSRETFRMEQPKWRLVGTTQYNNTCLTRSFKLWVVSVVR